MKFKRLLTVGLMALLCAGTATAASQLNSVDVTPKANMATVSLQTTGSFAHKEYRPDQHRVLIDLTGVSSDPALVRTVVFRSPVLKSYSLSTYSSAAGANVTRLELTIGDNVSFNVADVSTGLEITLSGGSPDAASASAPAAAPAAASASAPVAPSAAAPVAIKPQVEKPAPAAPAHAAAAQDVGAQRPAASRQDASAAAAKPEAAAHAPAPKAVSPKAVSKVQAVAKLDNQANNQLSDQVNDGNVPAIIRGVTVRRSAQALEVVVDGPGDAHPYLLKNPDRLVVDFNNAVMQPSTKTISVHSPDVLDVRVGRFRASPPVTRVVVDLSGPRAFEVQPSDHQVVVRIKSDASTTLKSPLAARPMAVSADSATLVARMKPVSVSTGATPEAKPTAAVYHDRRASEASADKSADKVEAKAEKKFQAKSAEKLEAKPSAEPKAAAKSGAAPAKPAPQAKSSDARPAAGKPAESKSPNAENGAQSKAASTVAASGVAETGKINGAANAASVQQAPMSAAPPAVKPQESSAASSAMSSAASSAAPSASQASAVGPANAPVAAAVASPALFTSPAAQAPDPAAKAAKAAVEMARATPPAGLPLADTAASVAQGVAVLAESPSAAQASKPKYTGEPISVNLKDVDLKDFFRLIHEISGLNIVLDPSVHGSVTVVLDDVPWDQALDIVLKNNSLDRELEGNVLRIAATDTLRREAVDRRAQAEAVALAVDRQTITRALSYAKASQVVPTIKKFMTARGDVISDERTNSLIISDIPSVLPTLDRLISQLDQKSQEVEIEVRVVSASRNFSRDIGFQLGFNWGNGVSTIGGSNPNGATISNTVAPGSTTTTGGTGPITSLNSVPLFSNFPAAGATTGLSFSNITANYGIDAVLTAAESHNLAKVLSRPRIVTQSNVKAEVKQGEEIPVYTAGTANANASVTYTNAVLRLTVTPQITADHTIFLTVDVENTQPNGELNNNFILDTQQATTQVLVKDGDTVVIGGVILTSNSVSTTQTPILGSIPWLGNLFKERSVSTQSNELIFFITPKIIQT